MAIRHPLDAIAEGRLRRWQLPSLAVALLCLGALPWILPGRTDHTLLDLVEAGSVAEASRVLAHWPAEHRVRVAYAVGLDYLMNPAYMNALALGCIWAGRALRSTRARRVASLLAWLAWSVVLTNAAENVGLFVALASAPAAPWPLVVAGAHYWAGLVVVACAVFLVIGLVGRMRSRRDAG